MWYGWSRFEGEVRLQLSAIPKEAGCEDCNPRSVKMMHCWNMMSKLFHLSQTMFPFFSQYLMRIPSKQGELLRMVGPSVVLGIWSLLICITGIVSVDEWKRILLDETESLNARIRDTQIQRSGARACLDKKRKRDLSHWMAEGHSLVEEGQRLVSQDGTWRCLVLGAKMRWDAYKLVYALELHDKKGHALLGQSSNAPGVCRGYAIPVGRIFGQPASEALYRLQHLLEGDQIGRIAIRGIRGIGKTFLMKHLHNFSLNRFAYVFWIPSPVEFTIECVQDAVAAVVKCEFDCHDDLFVRATKLSDALAKLGSFALFLDGVPKAEFSLEQVGIPIPAEGSKCKLVVSTSSTFECRIFDCFETVEIERLMRQDAYEMFLHKANIGEESVSSLDGIPGLLIVVVECHI